MTRIKYRCPKCDNHLWIIDKSSLEKGDKPTIVECSKCGFTQFA